MHLRLVATVALVAFSVSPARQEAPVHATAKIVVHNSEAKPYDESTGPALMEVHITETFTGDMDGESTSEHYRSDAPITPPAW